MENSFGYFITLFLGLFCVIRFKALARFMDKQAKGVPSLVPLPRKWDVLFMQIMFLIVGGIFVIFSLVKLLG